MAHRKVLLIKCIKVILYVDVKPEWVRVTVLLPVVLCRMPGFLL